jgi:outer membrane protein OmpA-like peptidoglycan-associated protein
MNISEKIYSTAAVLIFLLAGCFNICPAEEAASCKSRLPGNINGYQPAIVPVSDIFGRVLYFDRKLHPGNTAGTKDPDEIWTSKKLSGEGWTKPVRLSDNLNTPGSDVLFSISPSGDRALVYGKYSGLAGNKDEGFSIVGKTDGRWGEPQPLAIENFYNLSSQFYGSLSHDGKTLLMALERRDGLGKMDIYASFYNKYKKSWTEPMNLGEDINTPEMEATALIAYDNKTLYFASGGRKDHYGKMDIYMSRRLDDTWRNWSTPRNLGPGVNSVGDDSSIWPLALADSAFLVSYDTTSAREGIYMACIPDSLRPEPYRLVCGGIFHGRAGYPFRDIARIEIKNSGGEIISEHKASNGKYAMVTPANENITLEFSAIGYNKAILNLDGRNTELPVIAAHDITFKKTNHQPVLFDSIIFELDSHTLSARSQKKFMEKLKKSGDYPKDKYIVVGHADKKGSDEYNMRLSMRRARAAAKEMMKLGIPLQNIDVKWRGENEPVSESSRLNRRVEIYVIKSNEE